MEQMETSSTITISTPEEGETVTYQLVIIRGTTTSKSTTRMYTSIDKWSPSSPATSISYPVEDGRFTTQYLLQPGVNTIHLSHNDKLIDSTTLRLTYDPPPRTPPHVRFVYVLASDSDGTFQSPDPDPCSCDHAEGLQRLHTAALLIQSATADMMFMQNLGRRTFHLSPTPVVTHRLTSLTTAQAHKLDGHTLWSNIYKDLSQHPARNDVIDVAVMSFTRKRGDQILAHTALGGGRLALFGGASMFTWPSTPHDARNAFQDTRPIDSTCFDDSAGRAAKLGRLAITSTTIGAMLHELGHCLSLPHPCGHANMNGGGIMNRGFDIFHRLFIQPSREQPLPFWDRGSAVRLRYHRFLQLPKSLSNQLAAVTLSATPAPHGKSDQLSNRNPIEAPIPTPNPSPQPQPQPQTDDHVDSIRFEKTQDGEVRVHSTSGLGHVGYYCNRDNAAHDEFIETNPHLFVLPALPELRKKCQAKEEDEISVSVINVAGQITTVNYDDM